MMDPARHRRPPEPPTDVALEYHDGTVVPAELTLEGVSERGIARWVITSPAERGPWKLICDRLPPDSSIEVRMTEWKKDAT